MNRFFVSSLATLCLAAPLSTLACGGTTVALGAPEDSVGETEGELTAASSQLAGSYFTAKPTTAGFVRLTLAEDGTYTAELDAPAVACIQAPCVVLENGTWRATKKGPALRLHLRASGAAVRTYGATKTTAGLELTRDGVVERLRALPADACIRDSECASGQRCTAAPACLAALCAEEDPYCCGFSTCQPASAPPTDPPAPKPECWGAWLDQFGGCRAPNDGAYPAICCEHLAK